MIYLYIILEAICMAVCIVFASLAHCKLPMIKKITSKQTTLYTQHKCYPFTNSKVSINQANIYLKDYRKTLIRVSLVILGQIIVSVASGVSAIIFAVLIGKYLNGV